MREGNRLWIVPGLVVFALGSARAQEPGAGGREPAPPLEGPVTQLDPIPPPPSNTGAGSGAFRAQPREMPREVLQAPAARDDAGGVRIGREPPADIVEHPTARRPSLKARWVPGYWDWDGARREFVWVGGSWQVPPRGSFWVAGRWVRDAGGWYRVPGFWAQRRDRDAVLARGERAGRPAWRATGPPADHPNDSPGAAPGPDFFYVPGHHVPDGDVLTWKPGFWARVRPGWDWVPARWVRRADGWEYRAGYWAREPNGLAANGERTQRSTARPAPEGPPPPNGEDEALPSKPVPDAEQAPPPSLEPERDSIPGALRVRPRRVIVREGPDFIGPLTGMPYYMIRPPGSFPYGPGGVVVPGAVPPFVRRILDRVLP